MFKEQNREEFLRGFFFYGVIGLICSELFVFLLFCSLNANIQDTSYYDGFGLLKNVVPVFPILITGILFYCVGYAFRGKERKSIPIDLDEKTDEEKEILIGILRKSMKGEKNAKGFGN